MPPLVPGEGNLLKTDSCTSQETKVLFPACTVTLLFNICAVSGPPLPHFLSLTFFQCAYQKHLKITKYNQLHVSAITAEQEMTCNTQCLSLQKIMENMNLQALPKCDFGTSQTL